MKDLDNMDNKELEILLNDLESDRVERKASISDSDKIREAICSFANDMPDHRLPGIIFVGVRDDGGCANLTITDELLRTIADMRSDGNILPIPTMTVEKRTLHGCDIAVVIVQPSYYPPVRYKGRICIRVGPRRALASMEEEQRLNEKRRVRDLPYDLHPVSNESYRDFDEDLFRRIYLPAAIDLEVLQANERTLVQQMYSLRFLSSQDPPLPTVVGLLTIGKNPAAYIYGAYVQFIRIEGIYLEDPIADQKEIHGPFPDLLHQLDEILKANIRIATDIRSSSIEQRHPDYPLDALQQLVRNAVMHRNYATSNAPVRINWFSDRIEIQNPGGPYGQVTQDNFGTPGITDYRNPNIAEVMRNLGFVQRFGIGIQIAKRSLASNGNPEPVFDVQDNFILVTVRRKT